MASLQVVTELEAADECTAEGIIPRRARDVQRAVGPGTTDVGAQIKPRPIIERQCHGGRINWSPDWHIGRRGGICHANVKKGANHKRKQVARHVPSFKGQWCRSSQCPTIEAKVEDRNSCDLKISKDCDGKDTIKIRGKVPPADGDPPRW